MNLKDLLDGLTAGLFSLFLLFLSFFVSVFISYIFGSSFHQKIVTFIFGFGSIPESLNTLESFHLINVRMIFRIIYLMFLLIICSLLLNRTRIKKNIVPAIFVSSCLILVVSVFVLIDFNSFWEGLHFLLFPQGNYEFSLDSGFSEYFVSGFFKKFIFLLGIVYIGVCSISYLKSNICLKF